MNLLEAIEELNILQEDNENSSEKISIPYKDILTE